MRFLFPHLKYICYTDFLHVKSWWPLETSFKETYKHGLAFRNETKRLLIILI